MLDVDVVAEDVRPPSAVSLDGRVGHSRQLECRRAATSEGVTGVLRGVEVSGAAL